MLNMLRNKIKKIKFIYLPYKRIKNNIVNRNKNKRLNKNGYKLLNDVSIALSKNDIKAFCAYGTLLGFIREGKIISHDLDLDMGVLNDDNFSWEKLDNILKKIGLDVHHYFIYDNEITEKTYIRDGITIDFFRYKKLSNEMIGYIYYKDKTINYKNDKTYSIRISKVPIINNISLKKINEINVLIPENSIEYLEKVYGKNWKIPDANFKHEEEVIQNEFSLLCEEKNGTIK